MQHNHKINFRSDLDNPDQRLAQEIEPLASNALSFSATFLKKVLEMTIFLIIVWSISQFVAVSLSGYTIIGNLIAVYLTQELNKINDEELESKAEYTYCLTHVRNHAESIAFFQQVENIEDLSVSVEPGEGLLIVGSSGRGKSSLLRAIAGLWNAGTGHLVRPTLEEVLFLPQRPYIILGTLREQLLYPHTNRQMSNAELEEVLREVNLQN